MRIGEISFWYADIGGIPQKRPPLPGDREADVCIIGAGYTGLWTAYYLKKANPSLDIVVLEREFAGFGASGRNGGWLSGGFSWSREKYLKTSSRGAVVDMQRAMAGTVDEVIRVTEAEGIDADILRGGAFLQAGQHIHGELAALEIDHRILRRHQQHPLAGHRAGQSIAHFDRSGADLGGKPLAHIAVAGQCPRHRRRRHPQPRGNVADPRASALSHALPPRVRPPCVIGRLRNKFTCCTRVFLMRSNSHRRSRTGG